MVAVLTRVNAHAGHPLLVSVACTSVLLTLAAGFTPLWRTTPIDQVSATPNGVVCRCDAGPPR